MTTSLVTQDLNWQGLIAKYVDEASKCYIEAGFNEMKALQFIKTVKVLDALQRRLPKYTALHELNVGSKEMMSKDNGKAARMNPKEADIELHFAYFCNILTHMKDK